MAATCRATDDMTRQLGDPHEASFRQALDFLAGRSCTPIATGQTARALTAAAQRELLSPLRPDVTQRETPGRLLGQCLLPLMTGWFARRA